MNKRTGTGTLLCERERGNWGPDVWKGAHELGSGEGESASREPYAESSGFLHTWIVVYWIHTDLCALFYIPWGANATTDFKCLEFPFSFILLLCSKINMNSQRHNVKGNVCHFAAIMIILSCYHWRWGKSPLKSKANLWNRIFSKK